MSTHDGSPPDARLPGTTPVPNITTAASASAAAQLASYTSVEEMLRVLAYAELRAIMIAWAGGVVRTAPDLVRAAVDHAITAGTALWHPGAAAFGAHLRGLIRTETAGALFRLARPSGQGPWDRPLAPGQHGDVPGLEVVFHLAGDAAGGVRASEPRSLATAAVLTDYVRSRVEHTSRR